MIDIRILRDNPEIIKEAVRKKQVKVDVEKIIALDSKKRELIQELEPLKAEQNKSSKTAPEPEKLEELKELKNKIKTLENDLKKVEEEFKGLIYLIPNIPLPDVPEGKDENDNVVLREVGKKPEFNFDVKDHLELGENLDIIDMERAAKVSGTRFGYLKGAGALLEFALIRFATETLTKEGFIPVIPPVLIKKESMGKNGLSRTWWRRRYVCFRKR